MGRELLIDNRGQVSAELIIVIAALLAVAMIFVSNLNTTVTKASRKMTSASTKVLDKIDKIK